jgi:hypothetical protein
VRFGVILPNYGKGSSPDGIRRVAEAAEELRFAAHDRGFVDRGRCHSRFGVRQRRRAVR